MKTNFLSYGLDLDQDNALPFIKKYRVVNAPVILILGEDGGVVERNEGIPQDIPGFKKWIGSRNRT